MKFRLLSSSLLCMVAIGCGPTNPPADSGTPDTGRVDVPAADLGTPDMGTPDMGTPDMGTPDMGTPDMGTPDMGTPDTGTLDTGTPDTGTPDVGTVDTGTPDVVTDVPADSGCMPSTTAPVLVSWYRGEDNFMDSMGTNHGAASGGTVLFAAGRNTGRAFSFRGPVGAVTADTVPYVRVPYNASLDLQVFSVEAWVRYPNPSASQFQPFVAKEDPLREFNFRNFYLGSGMSGTCGGIGQLGGSASSPGGFLSACSTATITDTNWHHAAMVYNGCTLTIYRDGVATGFVNGARTIDVGSTQVLHLGAYAGGRRVGSFDLDEVKIFRGVRTASDIMTAAQ